MSSTCTVCGKGLHMGNRSIGSSKCADCSRGTSVEAQAQTEQSLFANHPTLTEEEIQTRPLGAATVRIAVGAFLTIILGGVGLVGAIMVGGRAATLLGPIGYGVGATIAGAVAFRGAHPLDIRRWKSFAGPFIWLVAGAIAATLVLTNGLFAPIGLALGILFGYVSMRSNDEKHRTQVATNLRAWRASAPAGVPGGMP